MICVVFLSLVLFVHHILSMLLLLLLFFFCLFFNWWSVCNFTEYVRRLDEILAQKIEKFTQLRGKTALLTFFQFILVSLLLRQTQSFMLSRSQGGILSPVNEDVFPIVASLHPGEVCSRARNCFDWWKERRAQKGKLDLPRLGCSCRQDPSLFSYTALST